jgi:hypothetical protein
MMAWFDKVRTCVEWDLTDQVRITKLRHCLDSSLTEVIESLGEQLVRFKGMRFLMVNARFVQRLHDVLREWLVGLLDGTFDDEYVQRRWAFASGLGEIDLRFEDIILLRELTWCQLFEVAQGCNCLGEDPQKLSSTMRALDKALNLDLALIYSVCLEVHNAEMERVLLDRFLRITGFSRTLYENLAGTRMRTKT